MKPGDPITYIRHGRRLTGKVISVQPNGIDVRREDGRIRFIAKAFVVATGKDSLQVQEVDSEGRS